MGYLNDLVNPTTGEIYTVEDYGFWVLNGNKLTIDGDIDYVNGNHLIKNDASYKIVNAIGDTVARFGTDSGEMGIFVYPSYSPNPAAKFTSDEIFIGAYGEDDNFLSYDQSTGILSIKGNIDLSGSFVIQEQVNYVPKKTWSDPTALADFTYENCTPTDNDFYTTITSSYATAYIKKDGLSLDGAKHNKIRIRMRYNAEKHIRVQIRYKTTFHDYYDSYYAEAIHSTDDWFTFEVDMSALINASPDYVISTITGFQIAITYCDYLTSEQGLYLNDNEIVTDIDTFYPVDIAWITIGGLTADILTERGVSDGADVTGENTSADTEYLNGILTAQLFGNLVPEGSGLFIDGTHLGYHDGVSWKTYMDNGGNFYLSGSGTHGLAWDGETLSITGNVLVQNPSTVRAALNVADGADATDYEGIEAAYQAYATAKANAAAKTATDWQYTGTTELDGNHIRTGTVKAGLIQSVVLEALQARVENLSSISANIGSITGGSLNIANKFIVDSSGNTNIRSATTGARLEIKNNVIKVYDENDVLRVKMGDLSA
jgi:hypothetical protein